MLILACDQSIYVYFLMYITNSTTSRSKNFLHILVHCVVYLVPPTAPYSSDSTINSKNKLRNNIISGEKLWMGTSFRANIWEIFILKGFFWAGKRNSGKKYWPWFFRFINVSEHFLTIKIRALFSPLKYPP